MICTWWGQLPGGVACLACSGYPGARHRGVRVAGTPPVVPFGVGPYVAVGGVEGIGQGGPPHFVVHGGSTGRRVVHAESGRSAAWPVGSQVFGYEASRREGPILLPGSQGFEILDGPGRVDLAAIDVLRIFADGRSKQHRVVKK